MVITVCTSNERPDILADHYEHKQWAIDHNREKDTPTSKLPRNSIASGRTTIDESIQVDTRPITMEEITRSIQKMKNDRSPEPDSILVEFLKLMDKSALGVPM